LSIRSLSKVTSFKSGVFKYLLFQL
jgi:hypothetical protein